MNQQTYHNAELALLLLRREQLRRAQKEANYRPYGSAEVIQTIEAPEVLISGPAGTGKSRACLEKIHRLALSYPRFRGLIVRKTRESISESVLTTYEEHVLDDLERSLIVGSLQRRTRQVYIYPNGARIAVSGLTSGSRDQRARIMSTEFDMIYVQEAIELDEGDWNALSTRLRNGAMPYQQLLADTNPDQPLHWLYLRCASGRTQLINSYHEDNPVLFDRASGGWTVNGANYLKRLDELTGAEKDRLRYGKWVQSEGLVYDCWNMQNISDEAIYQPGDPVYWGVDDGYVGSIDDKTRQFTADSHPRVFLIAQIRDNGEIHVIHESAAVRTLSNIHLLDALCLPNTYQDVLDAVTIIGEDTTRMDVVDIIALARNENLLPFYEYPEVVCVDSSAAELRARMQKMGLLTSSATHKVEEGIKVLRGMIAPDENGFIRFKAHPRCRLLCSEMLSYKYNKDTGKPEKQYDHAMDAARYLTWVIRNRL